MNIEQRIEKSVNKTEYIGRPKEVEGKDIEFLGYVWKDYQADGNLDQGLVGVFMSPIYCNEGCSQENLVIDFYYDYTKKEYSAELWGSYEKANSIREFLEICYREAQDAGCLD